MRAAILVEQQRPLVVDEVALPESLEAGQVLVDIHYSGICGSQVGEIDGRKGPDRYLPHLLGHEGGAVVAEVGPGVSRMAPGDHVVMHWRPSPGIAAAPPRYRWRGEALNAGLVTTFNERAVVSENRLTVIPPEMDLELATLFGCPVTTGLGVVCRDAALTLGESIVVIGCGGVGLSIVQGAALLSAHPIVAVDIVPEKLALAEKLGATALIDARDGDLQTKLRALLGDAGADVVVENTGHVDNIRIAYELSARRGRTVLVGVPPAGKAASLFTLPLHFGKTLTGSEGGSAEPATDIPRYLALHQAGKLPLAPLITHRVTLDDINHGIDMMRRGEVTGRCVIRLRA